MGDGGERHAPATLSSGKGTGTHELEERWALGPG